MSQTVLLTTTLPDPEVRPKAKHRHFTAEYKKRILDEADACATSTQRGALVRREGLYSSHLHKWRQQRAQGILDGLAPKKRGVKADPLALENARLHRENQRLEQQLARAEMIIEVQKKFHLSCTSAGWVGLHSIVERVLATESHRNTRKISVKFCVVLWQI